MRPTHWLCFLFAVRAMAQGDVRTTIKIYDINSGQSRQVFQGDGFYEAPHWSLDGRSIEFNGGAAHKLFRVSPEGGKPETVELGAVEMNHDAAFSPDGKWHAVSVKAELHISAPDGSARRPLTKPGDIFYLHAWSKDSRWILGTRRLGEGNYDICRISPDGARDERLTTDPALDDGPDYSPDGKWIYFNSKRSGGFDIWRMPATGAGESDRLAQRITSDEWEDWFPHPSPDGKWLALLSYRPGTGTAMTLNEYLAKFPDKGLSGYNLTMHPYNADVVLRLMPLSGASVKAQAPRTLLHMTGGQGSLNLNPWSPDSKSFAYAEYEVLKK